MLPALPWSCTWWAGPGNLCSPKLMYAGCFWILELMRWTVDLSRDRSLYRCGDFAGSSVSTEACECVIGLGMHDLTSACPKSARKRSLDMLPGCMLSQFRLEATEKLKSPGSFGFGACPCRLTESFKASLRMPWQRRHATCRSGCHVSHDTRKI